MEPEISPAVEGEMPLLKVSSSWLFEVIFIFISNIALFNIHMNIQNFGYISQFNDHFNLAIEYITY